MKKRILWLICILMTAGIWAIVPPAKGHACSCALPASVAESLQQADAVFAGKVIRIKKPSSLFGQSSAAPVKVTFEVHTIWKGNLNPQTVVSTAQSSVSCGYDRFTVNEEYIVFAGGKPGQLETSICSRTKLLSSASQELAELGTGTPVSDEETGPQDGGTDPSGEKAGTRFPLLWAVYIIFFIAASALLFVLLWKRRK